MSNGESKVLEYGDQAVRKPIVRLRSKGDQALRSGDSATAVDGRVLGREGNERDDADLVTEEFCGSPRDLGVLIPLPGRNDYRSVLGTFAERFINLDYCDKTNCQPFLQPNSRGTDYFDNRGGATLLISFYKAYNDNLSDKDIEVLANSSFVKHGLNRPDLVKHAAGVTEYYEIKPDSRSGRKAGKKKVGQLEAFFGTFNLPYVRGGSYTPSAEIRLATVTVEGVPIEVFLRVKRSERALLLYKFCMRGELTKASKRLGKRVRKIALLGLVIGALIPIENPIEQPVREPIEEPAPYPVPQPIPASSQERSFILPVPFEEPIDGEFTFNYVRGLSRNHKKGRSYPIVISYLSEGDRFYSIISFRLVNTDGNITHVESDNDIPLNIAPTGRKPLVIKVRNRMAVTWNN